MSTQPAGITADQRKAALQHEINHYLKQGYRVISQTDYTAQLVKPKKLSCLWALLTLGLALIFYLAGKDQTVYLEVDERGKVKKR